MVQAFKRLHRSSTNKVFGGVLGGLSDYFHMDAVVLRLLWVLVTVFTGFVPGIIVYIVAVFIIPLEPSHREASEREGERGSQSYDEKEPPAR